jgi:Fic family protein
MSLFSDILKGLPENAVLRDKIREAEANQAKLETENAILKDDLHAAKAEITKLTKQVQELSHKDTILDEHKIQILKALAQFPVMHGPEVYAILKMERVQTDFHLQELVDQHYVQKRKPRIGRPYQYNLTQKGRQYILEHGLTA